ncbi:YceI family protein [Rhodovulum visakhapatnamense]|uniref:Polyisoprenoid-binding protein YceI n=1 Tax=Rhodovulum visakhapatnamense TaxID=364297 RepID=A0A4R8G5C5_9RHOB|nr:YceI family protein [Rhodovulum visakhapatnamense]TDX33643.1 polyisoprenoid-binding protein YceI [Rhodovulum visakhapatnamense]
MNPIHAAAAAALVALTALPAAADAVDYDLDPGHSQVLFSYEHLGFSTTWNLFSGWQGKIAFDAEDPAASSVSVSIPTDALFTGWDARFEHFMSDAFFDAANNDLVTFTSTDIEVTGDDTAKITGDLTLNGITRPVVLDATLTRHATHPMENRDWLGFYATTTLKRSDFDMGEYVPAVSDEVEVRISIEAGKAAN